MYPPLKDAVERGATKAGDSDPLWVVASSSLLLQLELRHTSQDQTQQDASDGSQAWMLTAISGGSGMSCEVEGIVGARTALMMSRQGLLAQQTVLGLENPRASKQRQSPE